MTTTMDKATQARRFDLAAVIAGGFSGTRIFHVVSVSGGKDSQKLLILAIERFGRGTVLPIFCDTGNENQAVYDHLAYLEQALCITIYRLKASFVDEIAAKRRFVARDQRTRREYTRVPKVDKAGQIVYRRRPNGELELELFWTKAGWDVRAVAKTVKRHGQLVRWTNKGKRRALQHLYPSGNAFLDLCVWKGRFPSRKAQFCTEELKRNIAVEFQMELMDAGYTVVSWQGVRRDESANRRNAKRFETIAPGLYVYRPLVDDTAEQVITFASDRGIRPNPLYLQGCSRVGCMPCINCQKSELKAISERWPEELDRIERWEFIVGQCCKRGFSTFFADSNTNPDRRVIFAELNIRARVQWSRTTRGGKQYDLLADLAETSACASAYGLCE